MKNRDRVIQLIEKLRRAPATESQRMLVEELLHEINEVRAARFNRSPVVWVSTIVLIFPLLVVSGRGVRPTSFGNIPIWTVYLWLIGGLFGVAWICTRLPKHLNLDQVLISDHCCRCQYRLEGHDSVLGDDLWVGPEICPECGQTYPAIG